MPRHTIAEINELASEPFTRLIGPVFEHSPWIAEQTWERRPFSNVAGLHRELCATVTAAGLEKQLALIQAHPDLVGRLALVGGLTAESTREQASAGLDRLTPEDVARFQTNNDAYQVRFGFPFVICARQNKKDAILRGFERRLNHPREEEIKTALEEIYKIAELRLRDLMAD